MFCTKCGNQMADGARFCSSCGSPAATAHTPATAPAPTPTQVRRLYMDTKGVTMVNYKFEIKDAYGNPCYYAATVSESMITYNARVYNLDGTEAMAIHQQKKLTMAAMNFDIVDSNGMLVTQAMQKVRFTSYIYELPQLGITVEGDFFAFNFGLYRNGQSVAKVTKKLMTWGDCYELEFTDPALEKILLSVIMVIQMGIIARRRRH